MEHFPIVRSQAEAAAHDQGRPALVEVPGKCVRGVFRLLEVLSGTAEGEIGRSISALSRGTPSGVVITNVGPASQAAEAGMARGDVLIQYDGNQLGGSKKLKDFTRVTDRSKRVMVDAIRGGRELKFEVHGGALGISVNRLS
jgi:S1-C subfamily serine protease